MDEVINQAPSNISIEEIKEIYEKNNNNVINTLTELWKIIEKEPKPLKKFDEIRDLCDEYDKACYEYLNKNKKK